MIIMRILIYTYISRFWMNNIFWICLSMFHAFNLFDVSEDSKNYCEVLFANRTECNIYQKILRYSSTTRPSQGRKFQSGKYPVRAMKRKIHLRSMPWKALCLLRNPAFQEMTEDTPWNAEKKHNAFHGSVQPMDLGFMHTFRAALKRSSLTDPLRRKEARRRLWMFMARSIARNPKT